MSGPTSWIIILCRGGEQCQCVWCVTIKGCERNVLHLPLNWEFARTTFVTPNNVICVGKSVEYVPVPETNERYCYIGGSNGISLPWPLAEHN